MRSKKALLVCLKGRTLAIASCICYTSWCGKWCVKLTSGLLDCKPCFSWSKWPEAVAGVSSKNRVTLGTLKPGHVRKCPLRITFRRVVFVGLNIVAWKYWISVQVELCLGMMTLDLWFSWEWDLCCCVVLGTSQMSHEPSWRFLILVSKSLKFVNKQSLALSS